MGMETLVDESEEIIKTAEGMENSNHLGEMFQERILDFRSELIKHPGLSKVLIAGVVLAAHIIIGATPEFNLVAANMDSVIDSDSVDTLVGALGAGDDPDFALYNERWDNPGPHEDVWLSGDEAGKASLEQQVSAVKSKIGDKIIVPGYDEIADLQGHPLDDGERSALTPTGEPSDIYWDQAGTSETPPVTEKIELIHKADNVARQSVENPAVFDSSDDPTRVGNLKKPEGVEVGTIETGQPKGVAIGTIETGQPKGVAIGTIETGQPKGVEVGGDVSHGNSGARKNLDTLRSAIMNKFTK